MRAFWKFEGLFMLKDIPFLGSWFTKYVGTHKKQQFLTVGYLTNKFLTMFLIYDNKHVERDRTDSSTHTSTIEKRWNIPYTNSSLGEEDFFTFNTTRLTQTILHCHHKVGIRRLPTKPPYPSRSLSLAFSCLNHILLEFGNVMSSVRDTKSNKLWLYKCSCRRT